MRVLGHRGLAKLAGPDTEFSRTARVPVMYLSAVAESGGGSWVLTESGAVRDVLDRDVLWSATMVFREGLQDGLQDVLQVLADQPEFAIAGEPSEDGSEGEPAADGAGVDSQEDADPDSSPEEAQAILDGEAGQAQAFLTETVQRGRMSKWAGLDWQAAREAEAKVIDAFGVFGPPVERASVVSLGGVEVPVIEVTAVKDVETETPKARVRLVIHGGRERDLASGDLVSHPPCADLQAVSPAEVRTLTLVAQWHELFSATADVRGAYLNTPCVQQVWARLPAWLSQRLFPEAGVGGGRLQFPVHPLRKMLYGKQDSGFEWDILLARELESLGWSRRKEASQSIWTQRLGERQVFLGVYVDDILLCAGTTAEHEQLYQQIATKFPLDDLALMGTSSFVGCKYLQLPSGVVCDQRELLATIIGRFDSEVRAKGISVRLRKTDVPGVDTDVMSLAPGDCGAGVFHDTAARHVCALLYVARHARPDLCAAVASLSRHFVCWSVLDDKQLFRLFGYVRETSDWVLHLSKQRNPTWQLWVDADFAGDRESRRSTSGYVYGFANCDDAYAAEMRVYPGWEPMTPINWGALTQRGVSLSTAESELRALVDGSRRWFGAEALLRFLGEGKVVETGVIACDSEACIALVRKGRSEKMRYVTSTRKALDVQLCWAAGVCAPLLRHIRSEANPADLFTKYLSAESHHKHARALGLRRASEILWWED